jgi:hypothetical protein
MPLFEVAIIEVDEDEKETLVFGPESILANDKQSAERKAIRKIKEVEDVDALRVLVRPFDS